MDLKAYLYPGWQQRIRPANPRRFWMDDSPESFAYRCLPLGIAASNGWELLSPCGFEAWWTGGKDVDAVKVAVDPGFDDSLHPVAIFGMGVVTFHVHALFRTDPGWNLWVSGPPNDAKDGIAPLTGLIETDWSPYSFTMNWRFTRPDHRVRFEKDEPFAFIMPVERNKLADVKPTFLPIDDDPDFRAQYDKWSKSRDAFNASIKANPPATPAEKWQKLYYRGVDSDGCPRIKDHQTKLRAPEFRDKNGQLPGWNRDSGKETVLQRPAAVAAPARIALSKRDWLLDTQESLRSLSVAASALFKRTETTSEEFLDEYYATNRPVILVGEIADWPALAKWTPEYLRSLIGSAPVEVQGGRSSTPDYERYKDIGKAPMPFDAFIDAVASGAGNDLYLTAYNSASNIEALKPLFADVCALPKFLTGDGDHPHRMPWIGGAGTFTPLHHDLTNNLLIQVVGRKRISLIPAAEAPKMQNDKHVFSAWRDIDKPDPEALKKGHTGAIRRHVFDLEPGEALFIPVGWWHQVEALDFSVSLTATNFLWPNDAWKAYPAD